MTPRIPAEFSRKATGVLTTVAVVVGIFAGSFASASGASQTIHLRPGDQVTVIADAPSPEVSPSSPTVTPTPSAATPSPTTTSTPSSTATPTLPPPPSPTPTPSPCAATFAGDPTGATNQAPAIVAFFNANPGRSICFGTNAVYRIDSSIRVASWFGHVYWRGATVLNQGGFYSLDLRGWHDFVMEDFTTIGRTTLSQITGVADTHEQEHAIAMYGGRNGVFLDTTITGYWGDGFWLRDYPTSAPGGDGSVPTNIVMDTVTCRAIGRDCVSVIQSAGTVTARSVDASGIGFDVLNVEPNATTDRNGNFTVDGGVVGTYGIGNNPGWGSGLAVSVGGPANALKGTIVVNGLVGPHVAMLIRDAAVALVDGNTSTQPSTATFTRVGSVTFGINPGITRR